MINRVTGFALLSLILLSGCGVNALRYQEPLEGPRARVRFSTTSPDVVVLYRYSQTNCGGEEEEMMRLRNGYLFSPQPKKLGMPLWAFDDNAAKEVFIDARQPFNGLFTVGQSNAYVSKSCKVGFQADFKPNSDYDVMFGWDLIATKCTVKIFEIKSNDSGTPKQFPFRFEGKECNQAGGKRS